jgi:hypothetical protein
MATVLKNDTLDKELADALDNVQMEAKKLRTIAWMANCMADPGDGPVGEKIRAVEVAYLIAEIINWKGECIDKLAGDARAALQPRLLALR